MNDLIGDIGPLGRVPAGQIPPHRRREERGLLGAPPHFTQRIGPGSRAAGGRSIEQGATDARFSSAAHDPYDVFGCRGGQPQARTFAPSAMAQQFASAVLEESDFTIEGRNGDRFRADFAREPRVVVPEVHWTWTSQTLLVMDYVDGIAPRDGAVLRAADIDPAAIAKMVADIVLDMILLKGRFHGDPHPGNLLCLSGDRIALLDLGMVGHVAPRRREEFIGFVRSLGAGDPEQLGRCARRLVGRQWRSPSACSGGGPPVLSAMVADFLPLMREEGMTMPTDLLLIFEALVTVDGVLSGIQPGFDLSDAMRRSSFRIARARLSPDHWASIPKALGWELSRLGDDAPRLLRAAVRRLEDEPSGARDDGQASAVLAAGRWIVIAIVLGSALMAVGPVLS